jgi:hypothetical protein
MARVGPVVLLSAAVLLSTAMMWWSTVGIQRQAAAQETKRYFYKIVDVPPDTGAMQQILNEYGASGWELVVIGMGDMTAPRLIFKK